MKRLLRALVLAGGVFLLLQGTRTRGIAQIQIPTTSCCAPSSEPEPSNNGLRLSE